MKYRIFPLVLFDKKAITFQALKLSLYSLLTQEHWKLVILEKISILSSSCSYWLQRVLCFNLGFPFFQINCFCIFSNWGIVLHGASFAKARCTTFDIAKVLKFKILPSIGSCHILHNFNNFSFFMIYLQ